MGIVMGIGGMRQPPASPCSPWPIIRCSWAASAPGGDGEDAHQDDEESRQGGDGSAQNGETPAKGGETCGDGGGNHSEAHRASASQS